MRNQRQSSLVRDQSRDTRKALRALWDHCTSADMLPFFCSYYFFISESLAEPGHNAAFIEISTDGLRDWIKTCLADHQPSLSEADYSVVSGVLRGLLIDVLATGDRERTTRAYQAFLDRFGFGSRATGRRPAQWDTTVTTIRLAVHS
jgi:hypothetical protein